MINRVRVAISDHPPDTTLAFGSEGIGVPSLGEDHPALLVIAMTQHFLIVVALVLAIPATTGIRAEESIRDSVTFYASFDEQLQGDFGGGPLAVSTRSDDPDRKGQYVVTPGFPRSAFRIVPNGGKHGGALEAAKVLPNRGRLFFPAKGNIAFAPTGWSSSVSFWLSTNPDTMLKSRYCDPIQITQKRAADGALWIDFPDTKPRDLRLGAFTSLGPGEQPVEESDPAAPLIHVRKIGFQEDEWHHIVMTWRNVDSGKPDSTVALWIDGRRVGELTKRNIAMKWDIGQTGIYVAVGLIGRLDELAVFDRELTGSEIGLLHRKAALLSGLGMR